MSRLADTFAALRREGRPGLVTKDFVKAGAVIVDVGMNRVTDSAVAAQLFPEGHPRLALFHNKGSVLVGDVHPEVAAVAGAMTPVPGGVGPLTITMLMMNTLRAARARVGEASLDTALPVVNPRDLERANTVEEPRS